MLRVMGVLVVVTACSGGGSGGHGPHVRVVPDGDVLSCFTFAISNGHGSSHCELTGRACGDAREAMLATYPNASECEQAETITCLELAGVPSGCFADAADCHDIRDGRPGECITRAQDGTLTHDAQVVAHGEQGPASTIRYGCFSWVTNGHEYAVCDTPEGCPGAHREARETFPGAELTDCAPASTVWCFDLKFPPGMEPKRDLNTMCTPTEGQCARIQTKASELGLTVKTTCHERS